MIAIPEQYRNQKISAYIASPFGNLQPEEITFSNQLNRGIQWSAKLYGNYNMTWTEEAVWTIHLIATGAEWASWGSCSLAATHSQVTQIGTTYISVVSGTDLASFRLGASNLSNPTLKDQSVTNILDRIGVLGRIVVINGGHSSNVQEYDIKEGTLASHVARVAADYGGVMRADQEANRIWVEPHQANTQFADYGLGGLYPHTVEYGYNSSDTIRQVLLKKVNKAQGEFVFTFNSTGVKQGDLGSAGLIASSVQIYEESINGAISYVSFYAGAGGTGAQQALFYLNPQYTGSHGAEVPFVAVDSISKSLVCAVEPPQNPDITGTVIQAQLRVTGIPPGGVPYDITFETFYPVFGPSGPFAPDRQRLEVIESPLWGTLVNADAVKANVFWERSKNDVVFSAPILMNPWIRPGLYIPATLFGTGQPKLKIESTNWTVSQSSISETISGCGAKW